MESRQIMRDKRTRRGEYLANGLGSEQLAINRLNHRTRRCDHVPFELGSAVQVLPREQDRDANYSRQQAGENQPQEYCADAPPGSKTE